MMINSSSLGKYFKTNLRVSYTTGICLESIISAKLYQMHVHYFVGVNYYHYYYLWTNIKMFRAAHIHVVKITLKK
jgi:hypothetical protein